jgi:hypothetical protein
VGLLHSSFFWTYATFQIVAGWLIDRYSVYWVFAAGYFLWSAATGFTGIATGFTSIFVFRLILGAGESVAYPSYSKLISKEFPESQRGIANALIDLGLQGRARAWVADWRDGAHALQLANAVHRHRRRQYAVADSVGCGDAPRRTESGGRQSRQHHSLRSDPAGWIFFASALRGEPSSVCSA